MNVGKREKPEFIPRMDYILKLDEEKLFEYLGLLEFRTAMRKDVHFRLPAPERTGRMIFYECVRIFKSKLCEFYENMRESGVMDTTENVYLLVLGFLLASNVSSAIAAGVAAIIAKQGLYSLCKEK